MTQLVLVIEQKIGMGEPSLQQMIDSRIMAYSSRTLERITVIDKYNFILLFSSPKEEGSG